MAEKEPKSDFRGADRKLIGAFLLVIAGWFLHLNLSYMLQPQSCEDRSKVMLHTITIACLVLTLLAAAIAWHVHHTFVSQSETLPWRERTQWMAMLITVLALGATLVIIAQEIPNVILRSCD